MDEVCCAGREPTVFGAEDPITVLGFDNPVIAMDVHAQDFIQTPLAEGLTWGDRWLVVEAIHVTDDGARVHMVLQEADRGEVGFARYSAAQEADALARSSRG